MSRPKLLDLFCCMTGSRWAGVILVVLVIAAATAVSVRGEGIAPGPILAGVLMAFEASVLALGLIAGALTL